MQFIKASRFNDTYVGTFIFRLLFPCYDFGFYACKIYPQSASVLFLHTKTICVMFKFQFTASLQSFLSFLFYLYYLKGKFLRFIQIYIFWYSFLGFFCLVCWHYLQYLFASKSRVLDHPRLSQTARGSQHATGTCDFYMYL